MTHDEQNVSLTRRDFLRVAALGMDSLAFRPLIQKTTLTEFPQNVLLGRVNVGKVEIKTRPDIDSQTEGELY